MKSTWQLQEAKNRFSEVVNLALTKGEQTITRHGKPVVVISSVAMKLKQGSKPKKLQSLFDVLQSCPDGEFLAAAVEKGRSKMNNELRKLDL